MISTAGTVLYERTVVPKIIFYQSIEGYTERVIAIKTVMFGEHIKCSECRNKSNV